MSLGLSFFIVILTFQIRQLFDGRQRKDENIQNWIRHSRQRTLFLRIFGSLQIVQVFHLATLPLLIFMWQHCYSLNLATLPKFFLNHLGFHLTLFLCVLYLATFIFQIDSIQYMAHAGIELTTFRLWCLSLTPIPWLLAFSRTTFSFKYLLDQDGYIRYKCHNLS